MSDQHMGVFPPGEFAATRMKEGDWAVAVFAPGGVETRAVIARAMTHLHAQVVAMALQDARAQEERGGWPRTS